MNRREWAGAILSRAKPATWTIRARSRALATLGTIVCLYAVLVAQPATAGLAKPDLVVLPGHFAHVTADLEERRWFFRGKAYELTWSVRIKNVGEAPAGASPSRPLLQGNEDVGLA